MAEPAVRLSRREVVGWVLLLAALLVPQLLAGRGGRLSNDSYQYLSVAENLNAGRGLGTDLPYFDVEVAHGTIPSPVTTFPPGFAIATAGLSELGLSPRVAGGLVSLVAALACVPFIAAAAAALGLGIFGARLTVFVSVFNVGVLRFGVAAVSEALFMLTVVAATTAWLLAEDAPDKPARLWYALAGLALGLGDWVRYAGLLVVAGMGTAQLVLFVRGRTRRRFEAGVITMGCASICVGACMYRNVVLSGTWKGGNAKIVHHSARSLLVETVRAFHHIIDGGGISLLARALQVGVLTLLLVGLVRGVRRLRGSNVRADALLGIAVALGVYCAGMFYVGLTSVISYGDRMFVPVVPLLALVLIAPIAALGRPPLALVGAAAYAVANLLALSEPERFLTPDADATRALALLDTHGESLSAWVGTHVAPSEPLVAVDGQGLGFALHHPVVSLVESEYSDSVWDESTVVELMTRYNARYLVLYAIPEQHPAERESSFLTRAVGASGSERFALAERNAELMIFARR